MDLDMPIMGGIEVYIQYNNYEDYKNFSRNDARLKPKLYFNNWLHCS